MAAPRGRDIVVVAASAGGVEALRGLLSYFPEPIPATLLVVLHVPAAGGKVLPRILGRAGSLPASAAADGEVPLPGHVYVAPPDFHMLLVEDRVRLSQGPRYNGHRPAADPLFISAALRLPAIPCWSSPASWRLRGWSSTRRPGGSRRPRQACGRPSTGSGRAGRNGSCCTAPPTPGCRPGSTPCR